MEWMFLGIVVKFQFVSKKFLERLIKLLIHEKSMAQLYIAML